MTNYEAGLVRLAVFVFGASLGSFLGAAAYRVPNGMSVIRPRSHCPACGHPLMPVDLVPVLSYIWRKGRCGYCGQPFSVRYMVIETVTAIVTLLLFLRYGFTFCFLLYLTLSGLAILLAAIDLEHHRLPNVLTLFGIGAGLLFNLIWEAVGGAAVTFYPTAEWQGVWYGAFIDPHIWGKYEVLAPHFSILDSLLGILTGGGILWLMAVASRGGVGGGDIKYLAAIGSFIGPGAVLSVLFTGALLGGTFSLLMLFFGRLKWKQPIPFGPFLSAGVLIVALIG
ncbi:MAG TPA: prepilin peptidase [Firmicutes bacterium]|nr:prepilin peptidase [Bacillota bacterium]